MSRATISTCGFPACRRETPLRDLSRRRTRAAAIVASAGLVAAGLLVSSPTTANPGASAPEEAPSADRPQGGHEPQHPLEDQGEARPAEAGRPAARARGQEAVRQGQRQGPGGAARARGHRPDLRRARRVRRHSATRPATDKRFVDPPNNGFNLPAPAAADASTGRCTTRSRSRTARRTTRRSGRTDFSKTPLRGHVLQPHEGVLRDPVLGPLLASRVTSPSG